MDADWASFNWEDPFLIEEQLSISKQITNTTQH